MSRPKTSEVFVAGHRGMAGSAIVRRLASSGYTQVINRWRSELDLLDQQAVLDFMQAEKLDYIFLAAAKVSGIAQSRSRRNICSPARWNPPMSRMPSQRSPVSNYASPTTASTVGNM